MTFAWWHVFFFLLPILPNLWSIWNIWTHVFATPEKRIYWLLLAVFVPVFGGLAYIFYGRKQAVARSRPDHPQQ